MDKKELGNRIKLARSMFSRKSGIKMTQQMLAQKSGISRSYMGDIESGRTYPTFRVLNAIAEACSVSLSFFSNGEEDIQYILESGSHSKEESQTLLDSASDGFAAIPVLGIIRAGEPIFAQQDIISYEYIPHEMAKNCEYFGLRVIGDSMNNSRIYDGDIVLVRSQEEVETGEIAVVLVDGEDATVKRFFKTGSIITLMPDSSNKEHQPRFIDITKNDIKILGKVVKVIINL